MFDSGKRSLDTLELVSGKDGAVVLRHRTTSLLAAPTGRPAWWGDVPGIVGRHLRDGLIEPDPDTEVDEIPEAEASNASNSDWQRLRLTAAGQAWLRYCRAADSRVVVLALPKPIGALAHANEFGGSSCPADTAWVVGAAPGKTAMVFERGHSGTIDAAIASAVPGQPHTVALRGADPEWAREFALAVLAATLHEAPDRSN